MATEKIGIILSTYNRPDGLRRMVDSVFAQDYANWVLYLADDCSTDKTSEICAEIAAENPAKVRHLRQAENWGNVTRGRNDAILQGIDNDGIDLFVFSDDDNTWKPGRLSAQLNFMAEQPHFGMSWCNCEGFKDGQSIGRLRQDEPREYNRKFLQGRPYIDSNEIMVRREVFEHVGLFDERLKTLEDWDFTLRVGLQFEVGHIEADLINYGLHNDNRVQKTMHLNGASCQLMAQREALAGLRYRVLFVRPTPMAEVVCHSHTQVMDYIVNAFERLPFVQYKQVNAAEPIEQIADSFRPNLVMYFYPARIPGHAVSWLGSRPYPSLGLCIEDPYAHDLNKIVRPIYEWFVTNEAICLKAYKTPSKPYALVMPTLSADSVEHKYREGAPKEIDILLVGAPYETRRAAIEMLSPLVMAGKKIVVAGEGWRNFGYPVEIINRNISGVEYADLIAKSHITLIVNRAGCGNGNPRTPARGYLEAYAGACMLMQQDREDLPRYFTEGVEYIGWKQLGEMVDKAADLLNDHKRTERISKAAYERAKHYTYEARLTRLFMFTRGYRANDDIK